jgi:hypothetical protein
VAFADVDAAEPGATEPDRVDKALLLGVHAVRVEVDDDVGASIRSISSSACSAVLTRLLS